MVKRKKIKLTKTPYLCGTIRHCKIKKKKNNKTLHSTTIYNAMLSVQNDNIR